MRGFVLFIIATCLKLIIAPFAYLYGTIVSIKRKEWDGYNKNLALAKDQYGNALCSYLFNKLLITNDGYRFGNIDETISSCLGKNKETNTLTKLGLIIANLLDKIEAKHVENSIDLKEN